MRPTVTHLLALLALLLAASVLAKDRLCAVCHRRLTGSYLTASDGRVFCSQACYDQTLPKCATCGGALGAKFFEHEGKKYCSPACLSVLWPNCARCGQKTQAWSVIEGAKFCQACAATPRCAECGLPFKQGVELPDHRVLCAGCQARVVAAPEAVAALVTEAREALAKLTGEPAAVAPELQLVTLPELVALTAVNAGQGQVRARLRGFYHRQETTRTGGELGAATEQRVTRTVYLLDQMLPENVVVTAVHEHTHALVLDRYPATRAAPAWVQEGLAQFTAAQVAKDRGWTRQLQAIDQSPDPAYGDGYRFFRDRFAADGWPAVVKWLQATDLTALPANPPAAPGK